MRELLSAQGVCLWSPFRHYSTDGPIHIYMMGLHVQCRDSGKISNQGQMTSVFKGTSCKASIW